jgi:Glucanosyltransferase
MNGVFSGGLAYEFTQEPNDYGLVSINGTSAYVLPDYTTLQTRYGAVTNVSVGTSSNVTRLTTCPPQSSFFNINATTDLPDCPAPNLISNGISTSLYSAGKLITPSNWSTTYDIYDGNGNLMSDTSIDSSGYTASNPANGGASSGSGGGNGTTKSEGGEVRYNSALLVAMAIGVFAWNGLA